MSGIPAERQHFAERLATVLRRFEREGGDIPALAEKIGHERRDLNRWAQGTAMPADIMLALVAELPRHLADFLIKPTGLRFTACETPAHRNALRAASAASSFSADVSQRMADGEWCHRDEAAAAEHAQRVIADLQGIAGE